MNPHFLPKATFRLRQVNTHRSQAPLRATHRRSLNRVQQELVSRCSTRTTLSRLFCGQAELRRNMYLTCSNTDSHRLIYLSGLAITNQSEHVYGQ